MANASGSVARLTANARREVGHHAPEDPEDVLERARRSAKIGGLGAYDLHQAIRVQVD
jgi:hypothetical protein